MNTKDKVAVCSRSFSRNPKLRSEILERYSQVKFNDSGIQLEGEALIKFLMGCDKAITALELIDDSILSRLPQLKVIGKYGVGLDMIDLDSMNRHGVRLGWTPGVNRRSVSELVISTMISMLRKVPESNCEVKSGIWRQNVGRNLTGLTVGIIGCGNIGKDLVYLLQPFSCQILINDVVTDENFIKQYKLRSIGVEELLKTSDVVTLHVPLDASTKNILNSERLLMMKRGAILINMARGGLVDEFALKQMLKVNHLFAASFDVFNDEPPKDQELLNLPNFLATPHIGGSTEESILAMGRAAIDGLEIANFKG